MWGQTKPQPTLGLEARRVAWGSSADRSEPEQLPGAAAPPADPAEQEQAP